MVKNIQRTLDKYNREIREYDPEKILINAYIKTLSIEELRKYAYDNEYGKYDKEFDEGFEAFKKEMLQKDLSMRIYDAIN